KDPPAVRPRMVFKKDRLTTCHLVRSTAYPAQTQNTGAGRRAALAGDEPTGGARHEVGGFPRPESPLAGARPFRGGAPLTCLSNQPSISYRVCSTDSRAA